MKALAVVFILVLLALVGVYYGGGFADLDPEQQQSQFENNIKIGMSWSNVVNARTPRKMIAINPNAKLGYGTKMKFDQQEVEKRVKEGSYNDGFIFIYSFSANNVTEVFFDVSGNVVEIVHPKTAQDLFTGNLYK